MLSIIFAVALIWIALKILVLGFRSASVACRLVLPLVLIIGLLYVGIVYLAIPVMVCVGAVLLVSFTVKA